MNAKHISLAGGVLLLGILPFLAGNAYLEHLLVLWMLYALLALSLNIIIGYLGELSFGHAAFVGVGAYTSAILSTQLGLPPLIGLPLAGLVAALFGLVIGYAALRVVGPQFAILTLGFGSILYTVTNHWVDVTRGPMGISNIPPLSLGPVTFTDARETYYLVLGLVLVVAFLCHALVNSRTGRAFIAVRENAPLAASLGVNVFHTKLLGFVVATAIAGVGGAIYAHYIKVITPDIMGVHNVAALIIVVVVGGRGTIVGPILGALVYIGLLESLRVAGPLRMVVFAALLTGTVVFLPGGLVSLWQRWRGNHKAENNATATTAPTTLPNAEGGAK
ncbi:branched-chain amino acid ABC transporter permease [Azospirillum doebereinerae]|uniref:Branched-chain amino acid ABC transporter permease n=1 Tax=Azospirillum doebereinerae TaxID=92933 RepID=A0A433J7N8_9PROT|nr:branched-chain amino acid ABC transporter permease [Azospirillum doebereinerae]MCG5243233.1 branched-chain amino acid ABC transporter permease [Azospirillum doebereinerae]RUQ69705.1 branched-chain amino acid ABC transporter permease [Azospirillum doebereinerae]